MRLAARTRMNYSQICQKLYRDLIFLAECGDGVGEEAPVGRAMRMTAVLLRQPGLAVNDKKWKRFAVARPVDDPLGAGTDLDLVTWAGRWATGPDGTVTSVIPRHRPPVRPSAR